MFGMFSFDIFKNKLWSFADPGHFSHSLKNNTAEED
jgi:hypothetical protein